MPLNPQAPAYTQPPKAKSSSDGSSTVKALVPSSQRSQPSVSASHDSGSSGGQTEYDLAVTRKIPTWAYARTPVSKRERTEYNKAVVGTGSWSQDWSKKKKK